MRNDSSVSLRLPSDCVEWYKNKSTERNITQSNLMRIVLINNMNDSQKEIKKVEKPKGFMSKLKFLLT